MGRPRTRILNLCRPAHEGYLDELLTELEVLGYAQSSLKNHYWITRRFFCWTERHGPGSATAITAADLEAFRTYIKSEPSLKDGGPISEKTVYQMLRTVQLLYDYLLRAGVLSADPFASFTMNRPKRGAARPILTRAEVAKLYAACESSAERALLSLTYGCGLRVGELERLNAADVRLDTGILVIEKGKNAKRRLVPMSAGVQRDLSFYARRRTGREPAFLRHGRGGRLRQHTAQKWLQRLAGSAAVTTPVSVHVMRHSIASHLLAEGLPVEEVRTFLGHKLLATTERYTRVGTEQIKKLL